MTATDPVDEARLGLLLGELRLPGLASIPGSILLCASSPHARRGELWNAYRRYFGKDGAPVLVWQAPTRVMNPGIRQRTIDEAYEVDPSRAAAEYGAQFRVDVEAFLSLEIVEAAIEPGVRVRAPLNNLSMWPSSIPRAAASTP